MNRAPDIQDVVDTTDWIPMQLQPGDKLQKDCERLQVFATEAEMPLLQSVYEADNYAMLDLAQLELMRTLEVRAHGS